MNCPVCRENCDSICSVIRYGKIVEGCENCVNLPVQQGDSAAFYRRAQQVEYRRDITQPHQKEYAKAYPEDFRERYGNEALRKFG